MPNIAVMPYVVCVDFSFSFVSLMDNNLVREGGGGWVGLKREFVGVR